METIAPEDSQSTIVKKKEQDEPKAKGSHESRLGEAGRT